MSVGGLGAKVSIRDVSKRFGAITAVDGIHLEVGAGEFVTLLGPSGSGKTSLLNILAGFITPDAGDILVEDRSVVAMPPSRRGFGIVFQNYAIFPHLTVFENIAFPLRMRRVDKPSIAKSVREVLELVGLPGMEGRYAHQLSGGQQQRVGLARAVVFNPPVLLMDESLSALDKSLRQQLQHEIRALQQRLGVTVVFVTHDQEEALAMSDRIAVMDGGRVAQVGTGRELYEQPQTEFVARFFGESNLLDAVLDEHGAAHVGSSAIPLGLVARARPGSKLRLFLRPDQIRLAESADEAHEATIERITYLGESLRVALRLRGGPSLIARWPSTAPPVRAGDEVHVRWSSDQVRVFE